MFYFPKEYNVFHSQKIIFIFASSADLKAMSPYVAYYLDLYCLLMYPFRGFRSAKAINVFG